jgi:hypothetical protein
MPQLPTDDWLVLFVWLRVVRMNAHKPGAAHNKGGRRHGLAAGGKANLQSMPFVGSLKKHI